MASAECAIEQLRVRYVSLVLAGDTRASRELIENAARSGTPAEDLYLDVLRPALHEVGDRWERGEVSVAQEHLATAVTSTVLAGLATSLEGTGDERGHALVCCTPGERHALGGRMVADFMAADGWAVEHHADPVEVDQLAGLVEATVPDLVALSTTLTWLLPEARRACVTLKALTAPPRVAVGGRAYRGDPRIAELVGADLFAPDPRGLRSRLRDRSR